MFVSVPKLKPVTLASKGKQGCVICRKVCSDSRFPKIQVVKSNIPFFEVFVSYNYPSASKAPTPTHNTRPPVRPRLLKTLDLIHEYE